MEEGKTQHSASESSEKKVGFPGSRRERKGEGKGKKKLLIILLIIIILAVLGGLGWLMFSQPQVPSEEPPTPTSFVEETTPTPTEEPIDRSEISVEILNGTGIAGEAGYLQGQLGNLGYEDIEIGNASSQDYEATQITFASGTPDGVREEIIDTLEDLYQSVETDTSDPDDFDIQIIVGLRKGQSRPTATTAPKATSTPSGPTSTPSPTPTGPTSTPSPSPTP